MSSPNLDRIAHYFTSLSPGTLDQLADHYDATVDFRDPVNTGKDLHDLRAIFDDLFKQLQNVRIEVTRRAGDDVHGFLRWTMHYDFRGKSRKLEGISHFTFNPHGLVTSQHDFWDASFGVYAEFPLVGATLRGLRKLVRVRG